MGAGQIEVDRDVALAGILLRVIAGHPVGRRKGKARDVRAWRLDLDHLGPQVLQGPRAEGTGEHAGEIDDAKSAKRSAHLISPRTWQGPDRSCETRRGRS